MSITSWKAEFMPTYPEIAAYKGELAAAKHSLLKWRGLRKLEEHDIRVSDSDLYDENDEGIEMNSSTCALCICAGYDIALECDSCPLFRVRGNTSCTRARVDEEISPYESWEEHTDPEPMIKWLKETVEHLKAR